MVEMDDRDGASYLSVGADISGEGKEATGTGPRKTLHYKKFMLT
jgi:hypothetical protein